MAARPLRGCLRRLLSYSAASRTKPRWVGLGVAAEKCVSCPRPVGGGGSHLDRIKSRSLRTWRIRGGPGPALAASSAAPDLPC
ncbi:hypothetical protein VULLAG_LOCUS9908 [Vulpes lagopus]